MVCPFLTDQNEEVECFKECAFYNEKTKNQECPFMKLDFKEIDMKYKKDDNYDINDKRDYIKNYIDYFKFKF